MATLNKKKKAPLHDPDEDFFFGVTCRQMLEIAKLATELAWPDMHQAPNNTFLFGVREEPASIHNDGVAMQYMHTTLEKKPALEVRIYRDGYVGLYNWSGLQFRHNNPRQVAELVAKYLKP